MVLVLYSRRRAVHADEGRDRLAGGIEVSFGVGFVSFWVDGVFVSNDAEDLGVDYLFTASPAGGFTGLEVDTAMLVEQVEAEDGVLGQVEGDVGLETVDATGFFEGIGIDTIFCRESTKRELDKRCAFLLGLAVDRGADDEDVGTDGTGFGLFNVVGGLVHDGGEVGTVVGLNGHVGLYLT